MPGPFGTSALSWLRGLRVAGLTNRFHSLERYAVRFLTMGPVVWQPAGTAASNMCCAPALIPCDFLDTPDITASACYSAPHTEEVKGREAGDADSDLGSDVVSIRNSKPETNGING